MWCKRSPNLSGSFDEFGDNNRMFGWESSSSTEECLHLLRAVHYIHSGSTKDKWRSQQTRVTNTGSKVQCIILWWNTGENAISNSEILGNFIFILTNDVSDRHGACPTPISSNIAENLALLSAASMSNGEVPSMLTLLSYSGSARLFGIWPPTDMITPDDFYKTTRQLVIDTVDNAQWMRRVTSNS